MTRNLICPYFLCYRTDILTQSDPYQTPDAAARSQAQDLLFQAKCAALAFLRPDTGLPSVSRIALATDEMVDGFRPSGTFLFRSMARVIGQESLGVLLTGMGRDGVDGLRQLRHAGARTICQDEQSSVVFGFFLFL